MPPRFNFWRKPAGQEHPGLSPVSLHSGLLKEFLRAIGRKKKAVVLDIGPVVGPNIEFLFEFGMKLYVEDLLEACSKPRYSIRLEDQWTFSHTFDHEKFFDENFKYPENSFDGLICWDSLSYLDPKFAKAFIIRLSLTMKSKSWVLGLFPTKRSSGPMGPHKYRIVSETDLERTPVHREIEIRKVYQPGDVTQLFSGYQSQRFFLMKHNTLEALLEKR